MNKTNFKKTIAMNGVYGPNRGRVEEQPLEAYDQLTHQRWLCELIKKVREGDDAAKEKLPIRCPHYYRFKDDHRCQADIIPEAFTFQTCIDIDDAAVVAHAISKARELNEQEGMWQGMLLHMDYSARKKLHIDVRMPVGMTIEETQRAYCEALGVAFDKSCITPERFIYITDADSEIYRSEAWCAVLSEDELETRRKAFTERGLTIDGQKGKISLLQNEGCELKSQPTSHKPKSQPSGNEVKTEPSDMHLKVFDLCLKASGLPEAALTTEGLRHNSLKMLLPNLGQMMSKEELMGVLKQKMPGYAEEKDCQQLVSDFYEKYIDKSRPMTLQQKEIFKQSTDAATLPLTAKQLLGAEPPVMPKRLPKLVKLAISKEPQIYHRTAANAIFPALGAHFDGVKFIYSDGTPREATFMCCTMAPMSSGKSCVDRVAEPLLADIRERDKVNIERENEWKQECKTRGANKEKPKRPEGLCIQILESDMTNAAFVQKLVDAGGKYLYTIVDEVELFYQLKTNGNKSVGKIFRLAFDNKPYGQVRVGVDSVSGSRELRWNWNASTTIQQGQRFFHNMKADGTLSRINFTTIVTKRGQEMPVHGNYDDEKFKAELKPYIDRLNAAKGVISCRQAKNLIKRMLDECSRISDLADDELYEKLAYRSVIIAWLKAMTLFVAEGRWSKEIEDFAIWSLHDDMWCKMQFFGDDMREQMKGEVIRMKPGPRNLLEQLAEEFTEADAENIRIANGMERKATNMLGMWKSRGYVTYDPVTGIYKKTHK